MTQPPCLRDRRSSARSPLMRTLTLILALAASAAAENVEFGLARFDDKSIGDGWRLMSAADLNHHKVQFVTSYNEGGGVKLATGC